MHNWIHTFVFPAHSCHCCVRASWSASASHWSENGMCVFCWVLSSLLGTRRSDILPTVLRTPHIYYLVITVGEEEAPWSPTAWRHLTLDTALDTQKTFCFTQAMKGKVNGVSSKQKGLRLSSSVGKCLPSMPWVGPQHRTNPAWENAAVPELGGRKGKVRNSG